MGFDVDTCNKKFYLLSQEIYNKNNLRVLVTPLKRRLVLFDDGNKVTNRSDIKNIIDGNYTDIKHNKDMFDDDFAKAMYSI